jgi:putative methionine-R-sulfoxide reductase with GAF domain
MTGRDYGRIADAVEGRLPSGASRMQRMQAVVNALWSGLAERGVSWCGFYVPGQTGSELVLGPCRDRPACSPIGLHGVCGRAFTECRVQVIEDVARLGPDYIACDPRDRSEIVVPVRRADGRCVGVLDLDSHKERSFCDADVRGLEAVLRAAGLNPVRD